MIIKKRFIQRKGNPIRDFFKNFEEAPPEFVDNMGTENGFLLDKDIKGEIITVKLAPNESKIISHGLRATPLYRIVLRKSGAGEVTDIDSLWTDKTIGLKNEGANTVVITIKLLPG